MTPTHWSAESWQRRIVLTVQQICCGAVAWTLGRGTAIRGKQHPPEVNGRFHRTTRQSVESTPVFDRSSVGSWDGPVAESGTSRGVKGSFTGSVRVSTCTAVNVDRGVFLKCLKSAPRGAPPGPGGCTNVHLKILLDDNKAGELLLEAVTSLARAHVPREVSDTLMSARLTAPTKRDGGARGIATGSSLRRLVASST